jgi:hypothetical protein
MLCAGQVFWARTQSCHVAKSRPIEYCHRAWVLTPVRGSQVPDMQGPWGHRTGLPTHAPPMHWSPTVHRLPSLHRALSAMLTSVQFPASEAMRELCVSHLGTKACWQPSKPESAQVAAACVSCEHGNAVLVMWQWRQQELKLGCVTVLQGSTNDVHDWSSIRGSTTM